MKYVAHSFIGKRENNEDCCAVIRMHAPDVNAASPVDVLVLSDGMGGLAYGDRVSKEAVLLVNSAVFEDFCRMAIVPNDETSKGPAGDIIDNLLFKSFRSANEGITDLIHQQGWEQAGATLVVCIVHDDTVRYCHLGDSRLYHWQAGSRLLVRLTTDHTVPQILLEKQLISEEMLDRHPLKNQLMYYIGANELPDLQVKHARLSKGDMLLLCSDGISGSVSDKTMATLFRQNGVTDIADQLLTAAMAASSTDNMTLILYHYDEVPDLEKERITVKDAEVCYRNSPTSHEESSTLYLGSNILDAPVWDEDTSPGGPDEQDDEEDTFMDTMLS